MTLDIHPYGHRSMSAKEVHSILDGICRYAADAKRWTLDGAWISHDSGLRCRVFFESKARSNYVSIEIGLNGSDTFTVRKIDYDFRSLFDLIDDLKFAELKPTIDQIIVLTALNKK